MAYEITLLTTMAIAILFALSLNVITGFCGQVSLGHAAFFGIGAYTAAMLTKQGLPLALALAPAAMMAGAVGLVVGMASLRVRHDFLAITTMGVSFLFVGIVRKQEALGGEVGISGIPQAEFGRPGLLALAILAALAFVALTIHIRRSWMGFAFDSIADDEDTARILGIDVKRFKLWAFVIGTAGAGVAGGLHPGKGGPLTLSEHGRQSPSEPNPPNVGVAADEWRFCAARRTGSSESQTTVGESAPPCGPNPPTVGVSGDSWRVCAAVAQRPFTPHQCDRSSPSVP